MTAPLRGALFVEGHGENEAVPLLLNRLWKHLGLAPAVKWERPIYRGNALKNAEILQEVMQGFWTTLRRYDVAMVLYDADFKVGPRTACPMIDGPAAGQVLRAIKLPIPVAVVLPWKEYEHWLAACLPVLAGQPVVDPGTGVHLARIVANTTGAIARLHGRDGKGILCDHLDPAIYQETTHQVALTAMLDFAHLQQPAIDAHVPAFGTLCRACTKLAQNVGTAGFVYP